MKRQLVPKVLVALLLAGSAYATLNLLVTYVSAASGRLTGAGAAQWQFAFMLSPAPAVLGLLGLAVAYWSRPRLSRPFIVGSSFAAVTPLVLLALVLLHVY